MIGRHRPTGVFSSPAFRVPLVVVGALALIGLGTVALHAVSADADGCSGAGIRLPVASDPAIAPALTQIATLWADSSPAVNGSCIRVEITATASADLADALGVWAGGSIDVADAAVPTPAEDDLPVVWIPDSSYWLARVGVVDREMFAGAAPSIAASPAVLALPEKLARDLDGAPAGAWDISDGVDNRELGALVSTADLRLGMTEPRRDAVAAIGATMLAEAIVTSEQHLPQLVGLYRQVRGPFPDFAGLAQAYADQGPDGINAALVGEQAVLAYNAGALTAPLAALRLTDAPTLDFPYAVMARQPRQLVAAAAEFRAVLLSEAFKPVLAQAGLRQPDGSAVPGFPVGYGVTSGPVHVQALQELTRVAAPIRIWTAAKTPSRVIALADVTSSMQRTMRSGAGPALTRLAVMREAALAGMALFTADSQVGLWAYAGAGHQELVRLALLDEQQKQLLATAIAAAAPVAGDECHLYQTIIDGYQALLAGYDPMLSNTLVVFTDGGDTSGTSLEQVQLELEQLTDVTRPIRVVLLGVGPEADLAGLEALARTTGGVARQVSDPEQITQVFLEALLA